MNNLGTLFIISAPSGAGKTSLVHSLIKEVDNIELSISHTTRPKRPGEKDGTNYHFVKEDIFKKLNDENAFLEQAEVFGYQYGTTKKWVNEKLNQGTDIISEIDWQGCLQIKQAMSNCVSVFILPPSLASLEERLINRQQDDDDVIANRMAKAKEEISHYEKYQYVIVNDDFQQALNELKHIIYAHRLTISHQQNQLSSLISELLA